MQLRATIVGAGQMGSAYSYRLRALGYLVSLKSEFEALAIEAADAVFLALWDGEQSLEVLDKILIPRSCAIIDLSTQCRDTARACARVAQKKEIGYFAGGITGGYREAQQGLATLLLGPPLSAQVGELASALGRIITFPDAQTACSAKLLHNLVLILQAQAMAAGMVLAKRAGIDNFPTIMDSGTVGRAPSQSSVVRDFCCDPSSSYRSDLVAKDLRQILASFPSTANWPGFRLNELVQFYSEPPTEPYTTRTLRALEELRDEPCSAVEGKAT